MDIPLIADFDKSDPMNGPFSDQEFTAALGSCNVLSAPSLNGISYGTLLGFLDRSSSLQVFLLSLFNAMFRESSFPPAWRDTLVSFIPEPGSSDFRPISFTSAVCKTFERLIHKRLEYLTERDR